MKRHLCRTEEIIYGELLERLEERLSDNSNLKIDYDDVVEETTQKKYDGEYIDETDYRRFWEIGYSHGTHMGQKYMIDFIKERLTTETNIGNK